METSNLSEIRLDEETLPELRSLTHALNEMLERLSRGFDAQRQFVGNAAHELRTPMNEALRLMQEEGFDNADIVFITDGECLLPEEYISNLQKEQSARRFTITGILLDQESKGMDFSLKAFCQNIYRTSELTGDAVVAKVINDRI